MLSLLKRSRFSLPHLLNHPLPVLRLPRRKAMMKKTCMAKLQLFQLSRKKTMDFRLKKANK